MDGDYPGMPGPGATDLELAWSDADRIVAALLYLLVQLSTRGGDVGTVLAIGQHLELLAGRRDVSPALRTTALQLRDLWLRSCAQAQQQVASERRTH